MASPAETDQTPRQDHSNPDLTLHPNLSPPIRTLPATDPQDHPPDKPVLVDPPLPQTTLLSSPPITDLTVTAAPAAAALRRGGHKRKKMANKRRALEKKSVKKLEILTNTLRPIPFVPDKSLDFSSHEKLLKRLGLRDFVHLEFDGTLRPDLVAQLIATYNSSGRCSYVNQARINVTRADVARALKLPVKKDKDSATEVEDSRDCVGFMEEFVAKWMLLQEDTWMMPAEVLNWTKVIKEGHFEKMDWAGLIWFMMEKELTSPELGNCYYASHMQCLIKCQKEDLLRTKTKVDVDIKEEDEEEECSEDVKMVDGDDEFRAELELEEHNIELSLGGQDNTAKDDVEEQEVGDDDAMDFGERREDDNELLSINVTSDSGSDYLLRRCNLGDVGFVNCDGEEKIEEEVEVGEREEQEEAVEQVKRGEQEELEHEHEEVEDDEEEHEGGFPLSLRVETSKNGTLEGVNSTNILQAMEVAQFPFGAGLPNRNNSSCEFLASRDNTQTVPGSSSSFLGNGNKRDIEHENDLSHQSLIGGNKRLRVNGEWDDKSDFDMCIEQVQQMIGKARMLYAEKEQAIGESNVSQQMLINELQQRDRIIEHLHKAKFEEHQKTQMEVYRLERELYMMGNLLEGYRKALKESHRAFAEYRARCPQGDEPLYKDVNGSGGLVLSTMELEKQRLKLEEEERLRRLSIERKIEDFETGWTIKFEIHKKTVDLLVSRFSEAKKEVESLRNSSANRKASESVTPECTPNES